MSEKDQSAAYNCAPWDANFEQHKPQYRSEKVILSTEDEKGSFDSFQISDVELLDSVHQRTPCPKCSKSYKYFCYKCYLPMETTKGIIPRLPGGRLPCKVDIVKCPKEMDGKSTAIHAKIICPDDVRIFTYPDMPDFQDTDTVLFLYPGPKAVSVGDIFKGSEGSCGQGIPQLKNVRLLVIDSAWDSAKKIHRAVEKLNFQQVMIGDRDTLFWRYQTGLSKKHLATIEAIYYFLVDYHTLALGQEYSGQYDDLLYLFKFMFGKIHQLYDKSSLRSYKWRHDDMKTQSKGGL